MVRTTIIGISGYSGISGLDGIGTSGYSGITGVIGTSGYSGIDGSLGTSGYSGINGISGYSGMRGTSGYSGEIGTGVSGYSGLLGASGYSGIEGTGSGSGETLVRTVTQSSHGFTVGTILRNLSDESYGRAKANTAANAEVSGIVSSYIDIDNFELTEYGYVSGLSGLIAGSVYYLSVSVDGAYNIDDLATNEGEVSKPILISIDSTSAYFINWRGIEIAEPFDIPIATTGVLGGVKVGAGLEVTVDGTLSTNNNIVPVDGTVVIDFSILSSIPLPYTCDSTSDTNFYFDAPTVDDIGKQFWLIKNSASSGRIIITAPPGVSFDEDTPGGSIACDPSERSSLLLIVLSTTNLQSISGLGTWTWI